MATFRVTWQFRSASGSTWNEVFYTDASDAVAAYSITSALLTNRLKLLHPANALVGIRSAKVGTTRVTGFNSIFYKGISTFGSTDNVGPDVAGTALVLNLAGTTGGSRKIWLRGIPDEYSNLDPATGNPNLGPTVIGYINALIRSWASNGYGLLQVLPPAVGALSNIKIINVSGAALDGTSVVTTAVVPLYTADSRVIIGGCSPKDLPGLNGRWSIIGAVSGSTFRIPYQTPQGIAVPGGNGKVRQETFASVNIILPAASGFLYVGTRKTKNNFSHSRGARRAVRLRTSL